MVQRIVLIKDGYDVNGYFYVDKSTGRGYFFDPGAEAERIAEIIRKNGLIIEKIIITHGHFDHIGGAEELRDLISAPVFIHENGRLFLSDPHYNLSEYTGTGKIKRKHAYHSHILTKKTKKQKRNLDHFAILKKVDEKRVKELLAL